MKLQAMLIATVLGIHGLYAETNVDSVGDFLAEVDESKEGEQADRLTKWNEMSEQEKEAFRKDHPRMGQWSQEKRENFLRRWQALSADEKRALRRKIRAEIQHNRQERRDKVRATRQEIRKDLKSKKLQNKSETKD